MMNKNVFNKLLQKIEEKKELHLNVSLEYANWSKTLEIKLRSNDNKIRYSIVINDIDIFQLNTMCELLGNPNGVNYGENISWDVDTITLSMRTNYEKYDILRLDRKKFQNQFIRELDSILLAYTS